MISIELIEGGGLRHRSSCPLLSLSAPRSVLEILPLSTLPLWLHRSTSVSAVPTPSLSATRRNGGESRSILTVVTDNARIPTMAQALAMSFESVPATSPFQVRHERSAVAAAPWRERSARTDAALKKCSLDNMGGTLPLRRPNTRRAIGSLIEGFG